MPDTLSGRKILVVEDEYFIAADLAKALKETGAEVVGPVATIDAALDLIEEAEALDGAVLDLNLQGELAHSVADELMDRGVPMVFATGYDRASVPERFAGVRCCEKPFNARTLARSFIV